MSNHLYDALFATRRESDAPLLISPQGEVASYRAFLDRAAGFANTLVGFGLAPGDRVAMQVPKSAEALAVVVACAQAGLVLLPLNTAYTADELDYFAGNAEPGLLLCDPSAEDALMPVAARHGTRLMTLAGDGTGSFLEAAAGATPEFEPVPRGADDLAALLYTSGTTGRSKGAMLSHGNLLSNAEVLARGWRFTAGDVLLHALPIFHTHGLFVACNITFMAGGSMIFLPSFNAGAVLENLPKATSMMGVPTFYTRLLDEPAFDRDMVRHMRLFVSGSAPLLAETHIAFEERTGHRILERYGMTETNMITSNPYEGERRAGTVGFALEGVETRVVDPESGASIPDGEVGMVEVRGPNVFQGYWKMPEKTAEEFRADGFFITGDMGRVDEDGYLSIVGRSKDLIISGGFNIYPKEVELLLDEQPGVLESAVIGAPHPDFGEGVIGVMVPRPGAILDTEAILADLKPRIARFKQPKALFVMDALPRNAMGKVQKAALREAHKDCFRNSR